MRFALAMLLTAVAAAGAFALAGTADAPDLADGAGASVVLNMRYDDGGERRRAATLTCTGSRGRATGYLRRRSVKRLCRVARELRSFLASQPRHEVCTEVWGGPDRARVAGHVGGHRINRRFARNDGCEIDDWDRAQPLLPKPRGAQMP